MVVKTKWLSWEWKVIKSSNNDISYRGVNPIFHPVLQRKLHKFFNVFQSFDTNWNQKKWSWNAFYIMPITRYFINSPEKNIFFYNAWETMTNIFWTFRMLFGHWAKVTIQIKFITPMILMFSFSSNKLVHFIIREHSFYW